MRQHGGEKEFTFGTPHLLGRSTIHVLAMAGRQDTYDVVFLVHLVEDPLVAYANAIRTL